MTYDALSYIKEYNNIKNEHKINKEHFNSPEGFLSGINKDDKFHPVITIVLYYGETPWDGPMCLSDMMVHTPEHIRPFFSDYKLNLVQILDSDRLPFYNKDVKNLFDIIRYIYKKDLSSIYEKYQSDTIDYEVIELISVITDNPKLLNLYSSQNEHLTKRNYYETKSTKNCISIYNTNTYGILFSWICIWNIYEYIGIFIYISFIYEYAYIRRFS